MKGFMIIFLFIIMAGTVVADNEYWIHVENTTPTTISLTAIDVECIIFNNSPKITLTPYTMGTFDVIAWWEPDGHCDYIFGRHPHIMIQEDAAPNESNIDFYLDADDLAQILRNGVSSHGMFSLETIPGIDCSANKHHNDDGTYTGANICINIEPEKIDKEIR